jgi:hypothetical protein
MKKSLLFIMIGFVCRAANARWTHAGCYHAGKVGDYSICYVQNFAKIK